jgi:hypothetical protein
MGAAVRIAILANAARARAELGSVGKEAGKLGGVLKGGIVAGAALAGAGLAAMATNAISGARESAQIHRVLESQIRGMGAAAATAFGDATRFAEDYGKAIGKDDDDILKVINKLSTFPAAFGKGTLGAEGMRRATKAAFDLEAAGVGNAEGNIIGLGKALDNPIKGLTALSKSGVSFTAEQKKQITNFTKAGRLADAQRVLLAGIETNAKGAAEAQADGLSRAKVALDGFAEGLATKALPVLDRFGAFFVDRALPAIETGLTRAAAAVRAFVGFLSNPVVQTFGASILAVVVALKIYSTVLAVIRTATAAYAAVQAVLNAALFANPIGLIILLVIGLIAAVVVAYRRSETFRRIVQAALRGVTAAFGWLWARAKAVFGWLQARWPLIKTILIGPVGLAITTVIRHWDRLRAGVTARVNAVLAFVRAIPGRIRSALSGLGGLLVGAGRAVIDGFLRGISAGFERVRRKLRELTGLLPDWKGPRRRDAQILRDSGEVVIGGFLVGLEAKYAAVRRSLAGFTGSLGGSVGGLSADGIVQIPSAAASAGAGGVTVLEIRSSGSKVDDLILEVLRGAVRARGGNVQVVLGR